MSQNIVSKVANNNQNSTLGLILWEKDKKIWIEQVLEWIKEARVTLDYEKLFERWSGGKNYNEENDFDGGLALLNRLLEFKDFEPPL